MKGIYNALEAIEAELEANPLIDRVEYGNQDDVNTAKGAVGSFGQIWITPSNVGHQIMNLGMTIILGSKATEANERDVFNKLSSVAARLAAQLQWGDLHKSKYQMTGNMNMTPLYPENTGQDSYAGWMLDFTIAIENTAYDVQS